MTTQPNTGPAELRRLAQMRITHNTSLDAQPKLIDLESFAAAWEADIARAERAEAALERARALITELEWCGVDGWRECPWCLGTETEHHGEPTGHKPNCKLAAALAPDGAR